MESRSALEKHLGQTVRTDVVTLRSFTMAEEYHQKYLLKQKYGLNAEMSRIYPDPKEFIDSTAVARVNGYSGGNGSKEQFFRDIDRLGLSETGKQELREIMQRQWKYEEKY